MTQRFAQPALAQADPYAQFEDVEPAGQSDPYAAFEDVTPEQQTSPLMDAAGQLVRGFNKGVADVASLPYRGLDWAIEAATGGQYGLPDVDQMPAWQTYRDQPEAQTTLGRYSRAAGEAVGASSLPVAGAVALAPRIAAGTPTAAQQTQTIPGLIRRGAETVAARPGAVVAAEAVGSAGAGMGHQAAADAGGGPLEQTLGALAGGIAPFALYRPLQSAGRSIANAREHVGEPGAYSKIAQSLPEGGVQRLTEQVATGPTSTQSLNQTRALHILGEEMVRANGDAAAAREATIRAIMGETGVQREAAEEQFRKLIRAHGDSQLTLAEYPSVARANEETQRIRTRDQDGTLRRQSRSINDNSIQRAGDVEETALQGRLDYLANASNQASAQIVRNTMTERLAGLRETMQRSLQRFSPNNQTIEDATRLLDTLEQRASQAYRVAHNAHRQAAEADPRIYQRLYSRLGRILNAHVQRTSQRDGEARQAMSGALNEFLVRYPDGSSAATPTLRQLQDARTAVRGMISRAVRSRDDNVVNALQPLYRNVTRLMEQTSPQWAHANRQWADLRLNELARELGESVADRAGPRYRDQIREYRNLAPEAQEYVQIEFVQKLLDRVENAGNTHDLAKLFDRPHFTNMVRTILGDGAAMEFRRAVAQQRVATTTRNMMGNSRTHVRQQVKSEEESDLNLVAAANGAHVEGIRMWLLRQAEAILMENRRRPMAEILTTPMSDVPEVARHIEMMRRQQARNAIRNAPADAAPRPVSRFATPLLIADGSAESSEIPNIDYDAPVAQVHDDIGRLPQHLQQRAIDIWAQRYVARERQMNGGGTR